MSTLHTLSVGTGGPRIAFLHGLFGQGRNWSQIAKTLAGPSGDAVRATLVDLPDHGRSPWSDEFSFESYAHAVAETLIDTAPGERWTVVGHSLGGKTAMLLALLHPELVERLCVVDIAPKGYGDLERFTGYMAQMQALPLGELSSRGDAEERFDEPDPGVKAFLLQNLRRDGDAWRWQANLDLFVSDAAKGNGSVIADFPTDVADAAAPFAGPVVWLRGGESRYIKDEDADVMRGYFPKVRQVTVKGAGHWVHTDAPEIVVETIRRLLSQ